MDHDLYAQFAIAELLGMTLVDLRENMSSVEFYGWIAYISEKNKREKKAIMKAQHNIEDDD